MEKQHEVAAIGHHHYAGIFLLALATLLLELALTRVLSVTLWYHFGFLIISTALLGFGAAGVVLALWRGLREKAPLDSTLALLALAFGLLTIACFWLLQRIPFDPFSLLVERRQLLSMPLYYLTLAFPFFCSGLGLALLLTRGASQVHRLYAFDLFGAGAGCMLLVVAMPALGGSGTVVAAGALGMLAAVLFAVKRVRLLAGLSIVCCLAACTLALIADRALPLAVTRNKMRPLTPPLYTAWNTFSRIDLYERPPGLAGGLRSVRLFFFDAGTAVTGMVDLRPNVRDYLSQHRIDADYPSGVAYLGKEHPKILIIGSGAGSQVLDALHFGAREITAVEINPIINEVVSHTMRDYWGDLFNQPEVHLVTEEGRSYVRRSHEQYDAIIAVHTISNAAIAAGALSLAENYALTREALADYLDHLTPDGILFLTRPEAQIPRLFATAREVLAARGVADIAAHLYAYRDPPGPQPADAPRLSFSAGFLLKKSPFTTSEIHQIEALLGIVPAAQNPFDRAPATLYSPLEPQGESIYQTLVNAPDLRTVYRAYATQLAPATDDRPFFNQHTRWSSIDRSTFRDLFTQANQGRLALEDRPVAEVALLVLLAQTGLITALFLLLPLALFARAEIRQTPSRGRYLLYFAALGLGFILVEIALLGRFTLFLGQPVYTYAVVLAGLLIFTGIGAYGAARLQPPRWVLRWSIPLLILFLMAAIYLLPSLLTAALGLPIWGRVALALALLAPLGILLGIPFPTGLHMVAQEAGVLVAWSWGINGFFTVIGTVSAQILTMTLGFNAVLWIGACCYLVALAAMGTRGGAQIHAASG
ncbi:MAG: hypothetical protein R3C14_13745 [Caldilineaceae bacterium]